jgi:hypothetical protein
VFMKNPGDHDSMVTGVLVFLRTTDTGVKDIGFPKTLNGIHFDLAEAGMNAVAVCITARFLPNLTVYKRREWVDYTKIFYGGGAILLK